MLHSANYSLTNFIIDLDSRQDNVNVALVVGGRSFNLVRSVINTQSEFESVAAGSRCNLVVRLLSPNQGPAAIASADLKSYSPVGDNLQTHGITSQVYETTFTVAQAPSNVSENRVFFDLASPTANQIVCGANSLSVTGVANTQQNTLNAGQKIVYSLYFDRYKFNVSKEEPLVLGREIKTTLSLTEQIRTALQSDGTLDATLYYRIEDGTGNIVERNQQSSISGSVSFKLNSACDNIESGSVPSTPTPTTPNGSEGAENQEEEENEPSLDDIAR